ncbi:glycosyltransferase [Nisaea denitrificans]|uniref:glycosyltransferase n=1 Tax=Nisaea denitrificans TaxID=390877 RepID=UPI000421268E|nr:glycosyltransferase [Nisaea denitrificans]
MKRIAFLIDEFPVLSETFVGNEIRAVAALGHPVEIIAMRRPQGKSQPADEALATQTVYLDEIGSLDAGLELMRSGSRIGRAWEFISEQRGLPGRSLLFNAAKIASVLHRRNCEHIHAHFAWGAAGHAIAAGRLAGISVSFVGHGTDVFGTPADLDTKLRHADFAVATCEDTRAHFLNLASDAIVASIACGIEVDRFKRPESDGNPGEPRLIYVGRLIERKGVQDVLSALSRLAPSERPAFDIVGDGIMRAELEEQTAALGLSASVTFLGSRPAEWLTANLGRYTALLAPFFEGEDGGRDTGPLVTKEAMAMEVPVIASTFMGLKEIVNESCGILVPPRDLDALTAAIRTAVSWSPEERYRLGQAGRQRVITNFTTRRQAEYLTAVVSCLGRAA